MNNTTAATKKRPKTPPMFRNVGTRNAAIRARRSRSLNQRSKSPSRWT